MPSDDSPDGQFHELHDALASHVERGEMPGLVALLTDGATVHVEHLGTLAFDDPTAMAGDSIFRIASLSKPVSAAATMTLVDEGVLDLDAPVDRWLPELADRRVLRRLDAQLDDTVPATRPITVEDLLTHRMGFGSVMAAPGTYPIQVAEAELDLKTLGAPWPPTPHTPDEWIRRLGSLPLMHQPGEGWRYNTGTQVLGLLAERATGQRFATVLRERLFEPLSMVDTAFSVEPAKRSRFTTEYAPDRATGELAVLDAPATSWWREAPPFPSSAAWLVSTLDDFSSFVAMLDAGGELRGHRVLSAEAVEAMTADRLTDEQRAEAAPSWAATGGGSGCAPLRRVEIPPAGRAATAGTAAAGRPGAAIAPPG